MSDGRVNNGGVREGAGRPSKADEQKIVEALSPLEPLFLEAIQKGLSKTEGWAVRIYADYYWGKPKDVKGALELPDNVESVTINYVKPDGDKG